MPQALSQPLPLLLSLATSREVDRISPVFQTEKLRPGGGKRLALDNQLVGWNWSPGLLRSKVPALGSLPHCVPVPGVFAGIGVSLWVMLQS